MCRYSNRTIFILLIFASTCSLCFGQQLHPSSEHRGFVPPRHDPHTPDGPNGPREPVFHDASASPEVNEPGRPTSAPGRPPAQSLEFSQATPPRDHAKQHRAPVPTGTNDPRLGQRIANISKRTGNLSQDDGQFGMEYDITPYTQRPGAIPNPEQVIISWILRQTGPEIWHRPPFGFMSATDETLTVYHTEEMQLLIADIVDRFVNPNSAQEIYSFRLISVNSPTWRTSSVNKLLKPIPVKAPGAQGWLVMREDYGKLMATLARRSDFRDHIPSNTLLANGQPTIIPFYSVQNYIRDAQLRPDMPGGYVTDPTSISEGYYLEATPLMAVDQQTVDIKLKLEFLQIEKMIPMVMDVPTATAPGQKITVEAPQTAMFKLDEQIRWPRDRVLLVDLGMVPMPSASGAIVKDGLLNKITAQSSSKRSNVLLFIESRGTAATLTASP